VTRNLFTPVYVCPRCGSDAVLYVHEHEVGGSADGRRRLHYCLDCHPLLDDEPPVAYPPRDWRGALVCARARDRDGGACRTPVGRPWQPCRWHEDGALAAETIDMHERRSKPLPDGDGR
jgi:hypothetical protein